MKLSPLEKTLLKACKEALDNLKGLDIPGEGYEADVNVTLRAAIASAKQHEKTNN